MLNGHVRLVKNAPGNETLRLQHCSGTLIAMLSNHDKAINQQLYTNGRVSKNIFIAQGT